MQYGLDHRDSAFRSAKVDLATQHSLTITEPYAFFRKSVDIRRRDFGAEAANITEPEV